jgi:DNA-binding PadR family transcriptional regulator
MLTDLFLLGFLARLGPQHGYSLKKAMETQAADFAAVKLPTLYHHLAGLEKKGFVRSKAERSSTRPGRTTFELTRAGSRHLGELVAAASQMMFRPRFEFDAVLFFADHLAPKELLSALSNRSRQVDEALAILREHRDGALGGLAGRSRALAESIFDHHEAHFVAERKWANQTLERLQRTTKEVSKKGVNR